MDLKQILSLGVDENKAKEIFFKVDKYLKDKERAIKSEYEDKLKSLELEMAVERVLFMEKARNIKATKVLIDFDKLDKDKIDERLIKKMVFELKNDEESKFLFEQEPEEDAKIKGFSPFSSNLDRGRELKNLSYEELCKYYQNI